VIGATLCGVALSLWSASASLEASPPPANPSAQLQCLRESPATFARAMVRDWIRSGMDYLRQLVGRFGLLSVSLPGWVFWLEVVVLLIAAMTFGGAGPISRIVALLIVIGTAAGIALSTYISLSPPCGMDIAGIQGRYFLPILPVALFAISLRVPIVERYVPWIVTVASLVAAGASVFTMGGHYYALPF
jgi:uncharacterized membrane protein